MKKLKQILIFVGIFMISLDSHAQKKAESKKSNSLEIKNFSKLELEKIYYSQLRQGEQKPIICLLFPLGDTDNDACLGFGYCKNWWSRDSKYRINNLSQNLSDNEFVGFLTFENNRPVVEILFINEITIKKYFENKKFKLDSDWIIPTEITNIFNIRGPVIVKKNKSGYPIEFLKEINRDEINIKFKIKY